MYLDVLNNKNYKVDEGKVKRKLEALNRQKDKALSWLYDQYYLENEEWDFTSIKKALLEADGDGKLFETFYGAYDYSLLRLKIVRLLSSIENHELFELINPVINYIEATQQIEQIEKLCEQVTKQGYVKRLQFRKQASVMLLKPEFPYSDTLAFLFDFGVPTDKIRILNLQELFRSLTCGAYEQTVKTHLFEKTSNTLIENEVYCGALANLLTNMKGITPELRTLIKAARISAVENNGNGATAIGSSLFVREFNNHSFDFSNAIEEKLKSENGEPLYLGSQNLYYVRRS
jgi:hypothetical protein